MFLSDQETATDLLYFESIAQTVVGLIQEAGERPISIGVHGDWGAGKSSILAMIEVALETDETVACVRFNGWQFQGFEDAKTVLIEQILDSLRNQLPASAEVTSKIADLLRRVQWLKIARKAGGLLLSTTTGLPIASIGEWLVDWVKSKATDPEVMSATLGSVAECIGEAETKTIPHEIQAFRTEFGDLLSTAKIRRLVILIDDLDRCLPSTAIETLEAIKLFLFSPQTAFVVAADEAMIEYAVKQHFPDLPLGAGSLTYARNYLEKLIQVPFRIPAMGLHETRVYIALLAVESEIGSASETFQKLRAASRAALRKPWEKDVLDRVQMEKTFGDSLPATVDRALTLSRQLAVPLTEATSGNPRQIKRFLNSLALRWAMAKARGLEAEIRIPALAKMILAERFLPSFYDQLAQVAAVSSSGRVGALRALEAGDKEAIDIARGKIEGERGWVSDENVVRWATIDPPLSEEDLRPYFLVTRDRRNLFGAPERGIVSEVLLEKLLSKSKLVLAASAPEIRSLRTDTVHALINDLCLRIKAADEFSILPSGACGLAEIVKHHSFFAPLLIEFAAQLPAARLGPWIIGEAGWSECFRDAPCQEKWAALLKKWAEEGGTALKKTAQQMSGVRKKQK